jgi:hypothetical protein
MQTKRDETTSERRTNKGDSETNESKSSMTERDENRAEEEEEDDGNDDDDRCANRTDEERGRKRRRGRQSLRTKNNRLRMTILKQFNKGGCGARTVFVTETRVIELRDE